MKRPHFFKKKIPADVNYNTPQWLYDYLDNEFEFEFDLAAVKENAKTRFFKDSLKRDWHKLDGWLWLNPPFAGIRQWVERSYEESKQGAKIVMLVPSTILCAPYMAKCQPKEVRFCASQPVFKNTFTDKVIRFPPAILIYDQSMRRRPVSFFAKPKEVTA